MNWRRFIEWVEFVFSLLSFSETFSQNTQVFFLYTNTCMVKSKFGVELQIQGLHSWSNRVACNTNLVAFFVGLI